MQYTKPSLSSGGFFVFIGAPFPAVTTRFQKPTPNLSPISEELKHAAPSGAQGLRYYKIFVTKKTIPL